MPVEECPHCICKIIFSPEGICPSCGKSKYILPAKKRKEILFEQDKKELDERIAYYNKRAPVLIIGGIILSVAVIVAFVVLAIEGVTGKLLVFGLLGGISMIAKGLLYIRDKKESKFIFDKKYKDRFPI